jgi:hypothetical protein
MEIPMSKKSKQTIYPPIELIRFRRSADAPKDQPKHVWGWRCLCGRCPSDAIQGPFKSMKAAKRDLAELFAEVRAWDDATHDAPGAVQ